MREAWLSGEEDRVIRVVREEMSPREAEETRDVSGGERGDKRGEESACRVVEAAAAARARAATPTAAGAV